MVLEFHRENMSIHLALKNSTFNSLYLSIETVVLGGLGHCLITNSVQKFAKKYSKLGGDVTFQAASFSQLIIVDRCQCWEANVPVKFTSL